MASNTNSTSTNAVTATTIPDWMSNMASSVLNVATSMVGLKMPSSATKATDPNQNPEEHFMHISTLPMRSTTTYFVVDISGSNDNCAGVLVDIVRQLKPHSTTPFGDGSPRAFKMMTPDDYITQYGRGSAFKRSTYTKCIEMLFDHLSTIDDYINFVFEGDGEFSDTNFLSIVSAAASRGVLNRFVQITLLFSPHTTDTTISTLSTQINEICHKTNNVFPIICYKLTNNISLNARDLEIINNISKMTSIAIPRDYIRVFDWVLHSDMTADSLSRVLENQPDTAKTLLELFQKNAEIMPSLLTQHLIYGRLYRALSMPRLYGKELALWMSQLINNKTTTPANKLELQNMLKANKTDPADVTANLRRLCAKEGMLLGFLMCDPRAITADAITDAMRRMEHGGFALATFARQMIKTAQPKITPIDKTKPLTKLHGFPILNPDIASQEECMWALKSMFCQYGDFDLRGLFLYVAALGIMTVDTQVIPIVYRMIEKALFDKLYTTMHFLGIDTDTNVWDADMRNRIMNPHICGLLSCVFTNYVDRVFPGVDLSQPSSASVAYYEIQRYARVYNVTKFVNVAVNKYTFPTTVFQSQSNITIDNIKPYMLVALKPFNADPQPNLPSIAYVASINGSTVTLEYLDRPMGTDDTVNLGVRNLIPLYNMHHMSKKDCMFVLNNFNSWLCKMHHTGASGELGPEMLMNTNQTEAKGRLPSYPVPAEPIKRNPTLYDANMRAAIEEIEALILRTRNKINRIGGFMTVYRNVSRATIIDCIRADGAFTQNMVDFLQTGNNPNADNIDLCKGRLLGQLPIYPADLPVDLYNLIRTDFKTVMVLKPIGQLIAGNTWTCSACLDTSNGRDTVVLGCTHSLCITCHTMMTQYHPIHGSVVNEAMCRCPVCRKILPDLEDLLLSAIITRVDQLASADIPVIMCCSTARCYYTEYLGCGQDVSTIDTLCPDHRIKSAIKIVNCPSCRVGITREYGCDVVTCRCGQKFCFGCGIALPSRVYDWECRGSQEACTDYYMDQEGDGDY